jgi:hypothetical protein
MFYKFKDNEVIKNTIKLYPRCNFKGYRPSTNGAVTLFYNNPHSGSETSADYGDIDLYDFAGSLSNSIYLITPKTSNYFIGESVALADYTASSYGELFTQSYPITYNLDIDVIQAGEREEYINSIIRIFDLYYKTTVSGSFCDNVVNNLNNIEKTVINIPRMFYGSSINKGSVNIKSYNTTLKTIRGIASDSAKNGILFDSGSNKISGFCFYNHGIILLFEDTVPDDTYVCIYPSSNDWLEPTWNRALYTGAFTDSDDPVPFELEFEGVNYLNTLTMFAHAPINNLNYSNNPTYLKRDQYKTVATSSTYFIENPKKEIKNIVYNNLSDQTASFQKETFISKIGIYDENKKLIAVTKLANPIRKRQKDGYTFKIKEDML